MKKRIAVLTPFFHPSIGGVQETLRVFSSYLASNGYEVCVFTSKRLSMDLDAGGTADLADEERLGEMRIVRMPAGGWMDRLWILFIKVAHRIDRRLWLRLLSGFEGRFLRRDRLIRTVTGWRPDLVLCAPANIALLDIALDIKRNIGCPVIVHTSLHLLACREDEERQIIDRLRRTDASLTNTAFETERLVRGGIPQDHVHELTVGLDLERIESADGQTADPDIVRALSGRRYLLYLGRLQDKKGISELVSAFRILSGRHPELHLVLAGGPTRYFHRHILPGIRSARRIHLLRPKDEAAKRWLFKHAEVFSMVSTVDSYGIVYLESWLAGRPVIGNDNGQTRHVIEDGVDGYLVRANDPQLLAQRIEILLADPDRSTRMGEAGRRKVQERFGDHAVERRLHGIVRSLIG